MPQIELYVADQEVAENLAAFLEDGGNVIVKNYVARVRAGIPGAPNPNPHSSLRSVSETTLTPPSVEPETQVSSPVEPEPASTFVEHSTELKVKTPEASTEPTEEELAEQLGTNITAEDGADSDKD